MDFSGFGNCWKHLGCEYTSQRNIYNTGLGACHIEMLDITPYTYHSICTWPVWPRRKGDDELEMRLIQCEVINALSLQNQQHEVDIKSDGRGISTIQISVVNNIVWLFIISTSGQFKMSRKLNFTGIIKHDSQNSLVKSQDGS